MTLKVDEIQNTSGGAVTLTQQAAAKAWVRFELNASNTVAGSLNISSLTDIGTGRGEPNHTNNFTGSDYSVVGGTALNADILYSEHAASSLCISSKHRITSRSGAETLVDGDLYSTALFGDLA